LSTTTIEADYIIVGAGSAGCVLAHRLSQDANTSVVLLETGGQGHNLFVHMPSAFYLPMKSKRLNWAFESVAQANLNNRKIACPRGRLLGGSSSINGMVYVRGNAKDFDRWETLGASGWNYEAVLPYFKKAQNALECDQPDTYRGHDGLLTTTTGKLNNPLYNMFLDAAEQAGYPRRDDLNGKHQDGFGLFPMTVDKGVRASTSRCYLQPAQHRPNLQIITHALVERIEINNAEATGVRCRIRNQPTRVVAHKQVIVSAGAINSPQLLLLSGIGSATELAAHSITVHADLPGVGKNLMDHLEVYVQQACTQPISLYKNLSLFGKAKIGIEWLATRSGLGATNHFEVGGFTHSEASVDYPDIQFHFLPVAMSYDGSTTAKQHGFQVHAGPTLSPSRGAVTLTSTDPRVAPLIQFNYMSHESDWRIFRSAIRTARDLFSQPAFDAVCGEELQPGKNCQTDEQLDTFIRSHAESAYHPCGTCKMGLDANAVVDPQGCVHGIDNLRVVDASIFPHITNGNLNAPTIMVAERIADLILDTP